MIYHLLSLYSTDEQVKTFVDSYDFYIVPIANPDGLFGQPQDLIIS